MLKGQKHKRERTEKNKLFWKEEHFRMIVESSTDLISVADMTGKFLYVSPSHLKILGYTDKDMIGKNSFTIIHPDDQQMTFAEFQKALQGIETTLTEFRARHKKGYYVLLEATVSSLVRYKNNILFVAVMRDVTARRELEDKKTEFINIASHELRTPLTTINAFAQLLEKDTRESDHLMNKKYIDLLLVQIMKMKNQVTKLIAFSELQTGKMKLSKRAIKIEKILKNTTALFTAQEQSITIKNTLPDTLRVDKERITFALFQVLQNALKYSDKNNPVVIRTSKNKDFILIFVENFGEEIPKAECQKIFQRFYQIESDPLRG